jgi:phosphoglycolate phosphatase
MMSSLRFPLLVFDWDGTLMDSTALIASSIQAAARDLGLPVPDTATAMHVIGLGLKDALSIAVPDLPASAYGTMAERYRFHFLAGDPGIPLFPGTVELLGDLKARGHRLAIATGKSTAGLERALQATGTRHFFAATRCADKTAPKPAPDMLRELMDEFSVSREETVMIGDTTHDLQMALNAGVRFVAISHGAHPKDALLDLGPLACVHNTNELASWLRSNA